MPGGKGRRRGLATAAVEPCSRNLKIRSRTVGMVLPVVGMMDVMVITQSKKEYKVPHL